MVFFTVRSLFRACSNQTSAAEYALTLQQIKKAVEHSEKRKKIPLTKAGNVCNILWKCDCPGDKDRQERDNINGEQHLRILQKTERREL